MKGIFLIGAGGHCRSLMALVRNAGYDVKGVYEDNYAPGEEVNGVRIIGTFAEIPGDAECVLAVGDLAKRRELIARFSGRLMPENIMHGSATVESHVKMGVGNHVFGNAFVNTNVVLGDHNILNTACVVEHESVIGSNSHISVGAVVCGRAKVGDGCFLGANSVIIDKISVCDNVTVGAGAVVVRDIVRPGTYVGSPARRLEG